MTYRNIFIYGPSLKTNGTIDVYYTGRLYYDANHLKDFSSMYDKKVDLLISCTSCSKSRYRNFIKVKK